MDGTSVADLIENRGLAFVGLLALCVGLWRGGRWIGAELVKPLVTEFARPLFDRMLKFIDASEALLRRQSDDLTAIRPTLDRIELRQLELKTAFDQAHQPSTGMRA